MSTIHRPMDETHDECTSEQNGDPLYTGYAIRSKKMDFESPQ